MPFSFISFSRLGLIFIPQLVSAACECGYSTNLIHSNQNEIFTDVLETDFSHLTDLRAQQDWVPQVWNMPAKSTASWGKKATLDDVRTNPLNGAAGTQGVNGGDPGLQLWVRSGTPRGSEIPSAEVASARRDMRYGSFRAGMKYTDEPGTCGAFFWYFNDTQEIDVEFLSSRVIEPNQSPLFLVIHAAVEGQQTRNYPTVEFRPDQGYHEYRFDWTPDKVTYYVDGQFLWETTAGVPSHEGGLTFSHWSNGDPNWSQGPPVNDTSIEFSYIKAYFNTTSGDQSGCTDPSKPGAICQVPDQMTPPVPSQNTTFLTPNKGLPGQDNRPAAEVASNPVPRHPTEKKVTTDGSCGGHTAYTCLGGTFGDCCSSHGYCGSTALYCGDSKCQPGFGNCGGGT